MSVKKVPLIILQSKIPIILKTSKLKDRLFLLDKWKKKQKIKFNTFHNIYKVLINVYIYAETPNLK